MEDQDWRERVASLEFRVRGLVEERDDLTRELARTTLELQRLRADCDLLEWMNQAEPDIHFHALESNRAPFCSVSWGANSVSAATLWIALRGARAAERAITQAENDEPGAEGSKP